MTNKTNILFFIVIFFITTIFYSQNIISGKIIDEKGNALIGASIIIKNSNKGTSSDLKGDFIIKNITQKKHLLEISSVGYIKRSISIDLTSENITNLKIKLKEDTTVIKEVTIRTKTKSERIEETSFSVNAISVKELKGINTDVSEILGKSEGVRIRLSGGVGSKYTFSLNGLSGKRIRFFVDHIPVNYLGSVYNLNNIPVNIVDNIEVYKGVVPIFLGADALGGAVNINTYKSKKTFLDASYSYGSFNTHKLTINSQYRDSVSGFTVRPKIYYLHSDNNYTVYDTEVYNEESGLWEILDVERFHDKYSSMTSVIELGYSDTKWADELLLGHTYNNIEDDEQTDIFGNAKGEVRSEETSSISSLKYKKTNLFNKNLDVDFFSIYNKLSRKVIDTASNRYNWGGIRPLVTNDNTAEIFSQKTLFEYNQSNFINRIYLKYEIDNNQSLGLNTIFNHLERQGENRLGLSEEQPFRSPNSFSNNITGLAYNTNLLDKKLNVNLGVKYYNFNLSAKNAITNEDFNIEINDIERNINKWGYYISTRFFISPDFFLKASYEKGVRFPETDEIFGNGLDIYANPELLPEESNNFNLGINNNFLFGNHLLKGKMNFFYREVGNYIDDSFFIKGLIYENISSVLAYGAELSLNYTYKDKLYVNGNITRIYNLNNEKFTDSNQENIVYRDQLPNEPYLFGNASVLYNLIEKESVNISTNYSLNYVDDFFLGYESVATASDKNIISQSLRHNVGTTIKFNKQNFSLNLACNNIFNALIFDNFNIQNPGRSFSIKLRYHIL